MKLKAKKTKVAAEDTLLPIRFIDLDMIVDSDDMKYRELDADHVDELKTSIKANGLDTPLTVWDGGAPDVTIQFEDGGKEYPATFLVAGQHRREALREFKQEDKKGFAAMFPEGIKCQVITGPIENAIAAQIRENVARKNPDAAELLPMMEQLRSSKKKNAEIARMIGKSKAYVTGIFDIADADEDLKDAVKAKKVGLRTGMKIAKEAKAAKKAGKPAVDVKGKTQKAIAKGSQQGKGAKRYSAKALYAAFNALPHMAQGKQFEILKAAFAYLADPEENELPKQLIPEDKPKAEKTETAKKGGVKLKSKKKS